MTLPKGFMFTKQEGGIFRKCKPWNAYRPYRDQFGCEDKKCKYIGGCKKYEHLCESWKW